MVEPSIREERAGSIGELVELVLDTPGLLGVGEPIWFRGQRSAAWTLEPGVWRRAPKGLEARQAYEQNLVQRFRNRAGLYGPGLGFAELGGWLQVMQHHGLPTRLLDWSRSPLVAAYFALENTIKTVLATKGDAVDEPAIWVLAPHEMNLISTSGTHAVTPAIESRICSGLIGGAFWGDDWANRKAFEWEADQGAEDPAHDYSPELGVHVGPSCMAVMANETNLRMLLQQGAFTVHSMRSGALDADPRFAGCLMRIVVPIEATLGFARQLTACGFEESGTYPDLDHLAAELTRLGSAIGRSS